jgi:xylulokinase
MYLGLDFGTSSVKGVLIDDRQKIIGTASSPLKVSRPHDGWSEQRPEDWWKAANAVVKTQPAAKTPTSMEFAGTQTRIAGPSC